MSKRKNQSINNGGEVAKRNTELNRILDDQKGLSKDLEKFKKDYSLLFNKMLNCSALFKIVLDKKGKPCDCRFLEVNPAFEKFTGLKRADIIGKTALEVLPGLEKYLIDTYGKVALTEKPAQLENYFQLPGKYYEGIAYSPSKGYLVTIFSDVTKRELQTKKITKLYDLQNAIRIINQLLLRAADEKKLYRDICNVSAKVEFIKFIWIGLTEEGSFDVKPVAYAGPSKYEDPLFKINVTWDDSLYGNGPIGISIKTGKPFVINDIKSNSIYMPWKEEASKMNFKSNISLPLIHKGTVIGAMIIYSDKKDAFGKEEIRFLKEVGNDIAIGIKSLRLEKNLQKRSKQLEGAIENIIFTMAKMSESKDPYTAGHQQRVSQLATAIARKMGFSEVRIVAIKFASIIHDIGKFSIPGEILAKPAKLSKTEFALIKEHPKSGYNIIKDVVFPWEIASIILQHHERLDGSGYPEGLKDKEILLEAKILAVADVVEAMSSYRPYRPSLGIDKALEEISKNKGKLYDPGVVDTCIKLFKEDGFKFKQHSVI